MMHAYTTAAIINFSLGAPETPVQPSDFMPSHRKPKTEDIPAPKITSDEMIDWQTRIANLAAEMKAGGGPMLDEIRKQSSGK